MEAITKIRKNSFEKRLAITDKLQQTYPNCVAVIVDRYTDKDPEIKKHKYLCKTSDEMGVLMSVIRKEMVIPSVDSLFFFTENSHVMVPPTQLIGMIYSEHGAKDKFLYLCYTLENTFGAQ